MRHVRRESTYFVVTDNLRDGVCAGADNFLDNVAQVVDQEAECLSVLRNGSKLSILC